MNTKRILSFLILLACFIAQAETFKFGVISDCQPFNNSRAPGEALFYVDKAFKLMKEKGAEAILIAGDIANQSDPAVYTTIRKIYDEIFGNSPNPPLFLPVMGNHDREGGLPKDDPPKTMKEKEERFMKYLKVDKIHFHEVVKGFSVIGRSFKGGGGAGCDLDDAKWVFEELDKAIARDPNKPIFVVGHNNPKQTVYGSEWGNDNLYILFRNYPQVVYFSGHTHYPNEDTRTIHQKDFTTVGTSCLFWTWIASSALPYHGRQDGKNMLFVEAGDKEIIIRRFQLRDNSEILDNGKPWTLPLPLKKDNFVYEPSRRIRENPPVAPQFPDDATFNAIAVPEGQPFTGVKLTGTAAKHPVFVHHYDIDVFAKDQEGKWTRVNPYTLLMTSDYYRGLNFMQPTFETVIPNVGQTFEHHSFDFQPSTDYRLSITPVETFGTKGKAATIDFKTPAEKKPAPEKK